MTLGAMHSSGQTIPTQDSCHVPPERLHVCLYLPALDPLFLSYEKFKWQPELRRLNKSISNCALGCQQCLQTISCIVSISKDRGEECKGISFFPILCLLNCFGHSTSLLKQMMVRFHSPHLCLLSIYTNLFPMTRRFMICGTTGIF